METVSTYFLVDNRQLGYRSFEVEASHASYHFNVTSIINKHITLSDLHEWISYPKAILFANSPTSCNISTAKMDLEQMKSMLQPKYSCIEASNVSVVNETWGKYLVSGLRRIKELVLEKRASGDSSRSGSSDSRRSGRNSSSSSSIGSNSTISAKHIVHIYCPDICLLGSIDSGCDGLSKISKYPGVQAFFDSLSDLNKCCNESLFVRIVCPVISQTQNYTRKRQFSMNSTSRSRGDAAGGNSALQTVLAIISAAQSPDGDLHLQQQRQLSQLMGNAGQNQQQQQQQKQEQQHTSLDCLSLHTIVNSPMSTVEEFRYVVSCCRVELTSQLNFVLPLEGDRASASAAMVDNKLYDDEVEEEEGSEGVVCTLHLELLAATISSGDAMHLGLQCPTIVSVAARNEFNATYLKGCTLLVRSAGYSTAPTVVISPNDDCEAAGTCPTVEPLTSLRNAQYNLCVFGSLSRLLAERDLVLILRCQSSIPNICPHCHHMRGNQFEAQKQQQQQQRSMMSGEGTGLGVQQYWALIPPSSSKSVRKTRGCKTDTINSENSEYMVMVQLVDRDDLLPLSTDTPTNRYRSLNTTADTTSVVTGTRTDTGAAASDNTLQDVREKGDEDEEEEEEAELTDFLIKALDNISSGAVLGGSSGGNSSSSSSSDGSSSTCTAAPYNAMAFPSGTIEAHYSDKMVIDRAASQQRRQQQQQQQEEVRGRSTRTAATTAGPTSRVAPKRTYCQQQPLLQPLPVHIHSSGNNSSSSSNRSIGTYSSNNVVGSAGVHYNDSSIYDKTTAVRSASRDRNVGGENSSSSSGVVDLSIDTVDDTLFDDDSDDVLAAALAEKKSSRGGGLAAVAGANRGGTGGRGSRGSRGGGGRGSRGGRGGRAGQAMSRAPPLRKGVATPAAALAVAAQEDLCWDDVYSLPVAANRNSNSSSSSSTGLGRDRESSSEKGSWSSSSGAGSGGLDLARKSTQTSKKQTTSTSSSSSRTQPQQDHQQQQQSQTQLQCQEGNFRKTNPSALKSVSSQAQTLRNSLTGAGFAVPSLTGKENTNTAPVNVPATAAARKPRPFTPPSPPVPRLLKRKLAGTTESTLRDKIIKNSEENRAAIDKELADLGM